MPPENMAVLLYSSQVKLYKRGPRVSNIDLNSTTLLIHFLKIWRTTWNSNSAAVISPSRPHNSESMACVFLSTCQRREEIKVTQSCSSVFFTLGWLCNEFQGATKQCHHPHNMMQDLPSCFMLANIRQFATSLLSFFPRSLWCRVRCLPLQVVKEMDHSTEIGYMRTL